MSSILTGSPPRAALVLLHGLGMRPEVLMPFPQALRLPVVAAVPAGPVALPDGGHAWWPVDLAARALRLACAQGAGVDLSGRQPAGRDQARAQLAQCLHGLAREWPGLPVVVVGFSQGGMLAVDYLLQAPDAPGWAGLALLSSSRLDWRVPAAAWTRLAGLPVLVAHGRQDADLAFHAGEGLRDALRGAGAAVQWLPFDGGHEIPLVAWRAVRRLVLHCIQAEGGNCAVSHELPP